MMRRKTAKRLKVLGMELREWAGDAAGLVGAVASLMLSVVLFGTDALAVAPAHFGELGATALFSAAAFAVLACALVHFTVGERAKAEIALMLSLKRMIDARKRPSAATLTS